MRDFFTYDHLPAHLADISKPFCDLATRIMNQYGDSPTGQAGVALQKLLEAKDAAVRQVVADRTHGV